MALIASTTRVLVRTAWGVPLTVPCEEGEPPCQEVATYDQVLRIDLEREERRVGGEEVARTAEPLGTLLPDGPPLDPPTRARERVTNGELFCAGAESRLGR